ncbi:hypothetical protein PVE_R1G1552 [Pseudomonas veronii 1YdBTEX2]|jgi:glyoxylase-like metal-dependent hydrolase (beta-lactamase superfamily II)|uniref:Metallo-beta-lactamase domain-containing protein n=1 Tax=Pseudomonas veronii 1YdBTEX2 TaxID=1295141 RepID=A0A1D3JTM1_PSEVE|nr:MBL fold metallo-hydrolase [Pseudomonas veronii]SBW79439.1 hypothetical protein PVE_R1G1552 [Pseudomonas veronii 1YdBTEX2]
MSDVLQFQVGDATVTRITEQVLSVPSGYLYPEWRNDVAQQNVDWLGPEHITDDHQTLTLSVHAWLIKIDGKVVLIDTASGNGKHRPLNPVFHQLDTPWLERLQTAGVTPDQVDFVVITHLHVDHVGWNTVLRDGEWVPTFPNATYLFSHAEYDFYSDPKNVQEPSAGVFEDSVQPIVDAGLVRWIETEAESLIPGLAFHQTKGHSQAHYSFSLSSANALALFSGDVMHHPIQVTNPQWNSVFCEFAEEARSSRLWALNYAADHDALFFSSHFAGSSVGRIHRKDNRFTWIAQ